ncbi:MAG: hypothetical protein DRQ55_12640, partial [Planctomycetota bacterium]
MTRAKASARSSLPAQAPMLTSLSKHRPRRSDPALLDALWVRPRTLTRSWYERLRDSALTTAKQHLLAIGPEGSGKSHLVALLVARLRAHKGVAKRAAIAWLPEDETTSSWDGFLLRILRALHASYGPAFALPANDALRDSTREARAALLVEHLLTQLGERTLIVVVEGLDDVLAGLGDEGCKRWRAFLQDNRVAATLATSRRLTPDLSDRERAFFNFFQLEHLPELSIEQSRELLARIADRRGDEALAEFVRSPTGRARVRALQHLTGGNPRAFVSIGRDATRAGLTALTPLVESLLDELTPSMRQRLAGLPDQQRAIVEFLCRNAHTVSVKTIAEALFISQQTAASQLKVLREKAVVVSSSQGRQSRYEPADLLLRLCVDAGGTEPEQLRALVGLLRDGYERAEQSAGTGAEQTPARQQEEQQGEAQRFGGPLRDTATLSIADDAGRETAFRQATSAEDRGGALAALIVATFTSNIDREARARGVRQLVGLGTQAGPAAVGSLGLALTLSIHASAFEHVSSADRESWTAAWRDAATGREALALPARLLDAGLRARVGAD